MNLTKFLASVLLALAIDWSASGQSQTTDNSEVARVNRALDDYIQSVSQVDSSNARDSHVAEATVELQAFDRATASKIIVERAVSAPTGRDLGRYHDLVARMVPMLKSEFFARANVETDPVRKRRFIRLSDALWGRDAARFLVSQLDDKRSAQMFGDLTPRAIRICDVALNVLYNNVAQELDLHIGFGCCGGYTSDTIVNDVTIEDRDKWITKLKNALIAKYGTELNVSEKK